MQNTEPTADRFMREPEVRRITGLSPGTYLARELAGPLGLDFYIGLPAAEDARTAEMVPPTGKAAPGEPDLVAAIMEAPESALAMAFINPPVIADSRVANSRAWRSLSTLWRQLAERSFGGSVALQLRSSSSASTRRAARSSALAESGSRRTSWNPSGLRLAAPLGASH